MSKIPKIIHYCWVGGNPKPQSVIYCIESWKKFCPDYEIREWNEANYDFTKNDKISSWINLSETMEALSEACPFRVVRHAASEERAGFW